VRPLFRRIADGLARTREAIAGRLATAIGATTLDPRSLAELETALLAADVRSRSDGGDPRGRAERSGLARSGRRACGGADGAPRRAPRAARVAGRSLAPRRLRRRRQRRRQDHDDRQARGARARARPAGDRGRGGHVPRGRDRSARALGRACRGRDRQAARGLGSRGGRVRRAAGGARARDSIACSSTPRAGCTRRCT
jgi:hypothetical protein